jgi:hypothetical protein
MDCDGTAGVGPPPHHFNFLPPPPPSLHSQAGCLVVRQWRREARYGIARWDPGPLTPLVMVESPHRPIAQAIPSAPPGQWVHGHPDPVGWTCEGTSQPPPSSPLTHRQCNRLP